MATPNKDTKLFKVIRADQLTRLSDDRGLESYYRIRIKTQGGVTLDVDLDEDDYTPEKARPILEEKARNADKILEL